jgi:hypothetical protein
VEHTVKEHHSPDGPSIPGKSRKDRQRATMLLECKLSATGAKALKDGSDHLLVTRERRPISRG